MIRNAVSWDNYHFNLRQASEIAYTRDSVYCQCLRYDGGYICSASIEQGCNGDEALSGSL